MTTDELKSHLLQLPQDVRADLAYLLIDSLDEDSSEIEVNDIRETLHRRESEIRNGTAIGIPADAILERLRKKYP